MSLSIVADFMKLLQLLCFLCCALNARAQSIAIPWSGLGHDPQHTGISKVASQSMGQIKWQMPVDLNRQYSGADLLIHYGAPLITRQNTVIAPVKTGAAEGFRIEARDGATGAFKWMQNSDYILFPHNWVPPFGIALTPKNRVYFPGNAGTVYYHDSPDTVGGTTGQLAFYLANYQNDPSSLNQSVFINTPITSDRYGNIYFGFQANGATTPPLSGGVARIAEDGTGNWRAASDTAADGSVTKVADNCAPALSNDQKTLYFTVTSTGGAGSYLVSVDSRTLVPIAKVHLKDVAKPGNNAAVPPDGSASPTIGPDGDVYFGVLENPFPLHNDRGWLLHFDASLTQLKTPGSFGWDDTVSVVPASSVPSYHGSSTYLLLSKYNNYAGIGTGNGVNKIAILDPNDTMVDPVTSSATVMKEVLTVTSLTPDDEHSDYPNAVREWCINSAAIDPFTKSAIVSCEDGKTYRWDFTTNALSEVITLTDGTGEAYTPTLIGPDGTVYAIANGILFAIGAGTP